jgi:hypothetical protein
VSRGSVGRRGQSWGQSGVQDRGSWHRSSMSN